MDKYLRDKLPNPTQEEKSTKGLDIYLKIEFLVKNLLTKKTTGPDNFTLWFL